MVKEIRKQTFKPSFGLTESNNSYSNTFVQDILVETMALELARNKSFAMENIFPTADERDILAK